MGSELWVALALVCVIEGFLPFVSPRGYRSTVEQLGKMPDQSLRTFGLGLMLFGVALLYIFH